MVLVNVKWGREKHSYEFEERILADIRLGELRKKCHDRTGVPMGGLTLIYGGATMKDDNAPLSCFGIKPNGQITMMGTKPSKDDVQVLTTHGDPEEYSLILKIQTSLQKAQALVAEHVPRYEQAVAKYIQSNPPPYYLAAMPPARKQLMDAHSLLSETLLQSLLVFDGVVCKQDFEVARATRREAVKETQKWLDAIDELNAKVKECDKVVSK
ncbi:MAG: hypothetical protein BYD32DRAFT_408711 [Podila humilis]|nr:MAG: hypothetical protein BYD32DRAFT_408711 [Podila humilis]